MYSVLTIVVDQNQRLHNTHSQKHDEHDDTDAQGKNDRNELLLIAEEAASQTTSSSCNTQTHS